MEIDHIFIFSNNKGQEADDLVQLGLTEGSSRVHKGQGTRNRKFYFHNFFLEILWVTDDQKINQEPVSTTQLGRRAQFVENGTSRFGLCLVNTTITDDLFAKALTYQPDYFPLGMSIDILHNEEHPTLPWTFRLPYRGGKKVIKLTYCPYLSYGSSY